jgi:zinc transporter ZupT
MLLLLTSIGIALTVIILGMIAVNRAGQKINMDRLQVFIALASGFMMAALFLDLLPDNIGRFPQGPRAFFGWSLFGMFLVIVFERYGVPRLKFIERFFQAPKTTSVSEAMKTAVFTKIETHDEHLHHDTHAHHDHHNLNEAEHCDHSHAHGHLHAHTHMEVLGVGEVCSAIACFMICSFFDGIALSSVQQVDHKLGLILVIGIIFHLLPEGILSGVMALAGGASLKSAQKVLMFIGGAFVLGAAIPIFITGFEAGFVAVASGIIIFVTLVQLLPTALRLKFAPIWIGSGVGLFLLSHAILDLMNVNF